MGRLRLTPQQGLLVVFAAATLAVTVIGALAAIGLLRTSLYHAAERDAGREARAMADLGLAAALSDGPLNSRSLRIAGSQYAAARKALPLTGAVIWLPSGRAIFARGTGRADVGRPESRIATLALATHKTQAANGDDPNLGPTVEAAVPLGARAGNAVVEFHFSRAGIQQTLHEAEDQVYLVNGIGALIVYLAVLPLLARLASRVPLPVDPFRRVALTELKDALERDEFVLHYQPKQEIATGRVVGVEALVRWNHPRRGLLSPGEFLPTVESSRELLAGLTVQVLDLALRDCSAWRQEGCEIPVAVNVAPAVLLQGKLVALVSDTLSRYDIDVGMLTLELTESALMQPEEDISEQLHELREFGVSLSIDDFGTGNSSLWRLRSLPVDELKVDRSFIAGISTDERDLGIARHIVQLGLELGLRVVAEGVEDERTLRLLRNIGCEVAQGFHLARPMPADQLHQWLSARKPRAGADSGAAGIPAAPDLI